VAERRGLVRRRTVIAFEAVRAFGPDAVIAAARGASRGDVSTGLRPGTDAVEGKPVVTDAGSLLGTVSDVVFDESNGCVTGFAVRPWPGHETDDRTLLPAEEPLVVGDVIIVRHVQHRAGRGAAIH
jgi:sporulation protein YlmC with PRC-barrel domain